MRHGRNLAGKLNARSESELLRISAFWQIPVTGRDRPAIAGQLYREMRDPRTARDVWETMSADERLIVQTLSLDDRALEPAVTIPELAKLTEREEARISDIAGDLYRKGILGKVGDDVELPVGELPRLFVPRELSSVFRRVQDEIDAGDISTTPLSALISLIDDVDVERASEAWVAGIVTGLHTRAELSQLILRAISHTASRATAISGLPGDARRIWDWMESRLPERTTALDEALKELKLESNRDISAQRRRSALKDLEERLLVWHSYGESGRRQLFIPSELTRSTVGTAALIEPPEAMLVSEIVARELPYPFAVSWDLITLLRELHSNRDESVHDLQSGGPRWLSAAHREFWNGRETSEGALAGYLSFLAALGREEHLVDGGGDISLKPGPALQDWRIRSFMDQQTRLLWRWSQLPVWTEGSALVSVVVEGASWPQFRRKVLSHLATLGTDRWFVLDDVAVWITALDPDILGPNARVATAETMRLDPSGRSMSLDAPAMIIAETIRSAMAWLSLVEIGESKDGRKVTQVMQALVSMVNSEPLSEAASPADVPFVIDEAGAIEISTPSPLRVWGLSAIAAVESFRPVVRYQLSDVRFQRALRLGADRRDIVTFLETHSQKPLNPSVLALIEGWASRLHGLLMYAEIVLVPDDGTEREGIQNLLREAGWSVREEGDRLLTTVETKTDFGIVAIAISNLLEDAGFGVRLGTIRTD